ncbi:MAG: ATP-binding protein [Nitrospira sp.]|nr:ATP-binding protein [Nitrospira sp.]
MKDFATIAIPSHPKYLSIVRSVTGKIAQIYEITETLTEDMKLAVDEACANVIKHAYQGDRTKKIVLKYKITKKSFNVIIEDSGIKAKTDLIKGRDLDDIRPGGLGIHFIKRVFDVFHFDETKKKGNRLILIKYMNIKK